MSLDTLSKVSQWHANQLTQRKHVLSLHTHTHMYKTLCILHVAFLVLWWSWNLVSAFLYQHLLSADMKKLTSIWNDSIASQDFLCVQNTHSMEHDILQTMLLESRTSGSTSLL